MHWHLFEQSREIFPKPQRAPLPLLIFGSQHLYFSYEQSEQLQVRGTGCSATIAETMLIGGEIKNNADGDRFRHAEKVQTAVVPGINLMNFSVTTGVQQVV